MAEPTMSEHLQDLGWWIGKTIAVLGGAAVLFRLFLEKWLDKHFKKQLADIKAKRDEALEDLKHEHQKELEQVRSKVQTVFSRVAKIHDKEFEVLPKAWLYLHEAYSAARGLPVNVIIGNLATIDKMSADEFKDFLEKDDLTSKEKAELANARPDERFRQYIRIRETKNAVEAEQRRNVFQNYVVENSIFINKEVRTLFNLFLNGIIDGTYDFRIGTQVGDHELRKVGEAKIGELERQFPELEKLIQERLNQDKA